MDTAKVSASAIEELLSSLGDCLNQDSARRVLALKANSALQKRVSKLADGHNRGELSAEEESEYGRYVSYSTFIAILKSRARQLLAHSKGE